MTITDTETVYLVVQEGGASNELYLWVGDSAAAAVAYRADCAEGAYRTTEPIEVSVPVGYDWAPLSAVIDGLGGLDYPPT